MTNEIILLDGGMGQELIKQSKSDPHPLWSTYVMLQEPDLVRKAHVDFIEAGASVITLNTYSTTPERLEANDLLGKFSFFQKRAIDLAREAIDHTQTNVLIAGCLPPLVASYRPDKAPEYDKCVDLYIQIVREQESFVDLFICETMASIKEARAAVVAARTSGKSVWCGLTLEDNEKCELRSGEKLIDSVNELQSLGQEEFLLNCSFPEVIDKGMKILSQNAKFYGGYGNGFTSIEPLKTASNVSVLSARTDLGPEKYSEHALNWAKHGASVVGGCCEIGPRHIKYLYNRLNENNFEIVTSLS
jgi:S-methylmethionine-dependent homocysteine/selenocysteine methylase